MLALEYCELTRTCPVVKSELLGTGAEVEEAASGRTVSDDA
jgi:hypothetical protein